ncbi:MAG: GTPase ObgE [Verrucomicrobiales bacterium]|nr:GTPase ObgE [Verrucomicrobiales bacterium]
MFVDHIKIHVKAGDGGEGCSSFRREAFVPKGGPDGGDGGDGGDVILQVDPHTDNLKAFFYQHHYKAEKGQHGKGRKMTGKSGKDLVLKVPPGTLVFRAENPNVAGGLDDDEDFEYDEEAFADQEPNLIGNELDEEDSDAEGELDEDEEVEIEEENEELEENFDEPIADLTEIGEKFVLCTGGTGGKGNWHYRSDTNQAPVETGPSTKGGEGWFYLELRKIADVGLVGFPNAGKSTLLNALSNATPKVAAYPFTTLKPMVGVMEFPGFLRATMADIPGLIEGAHQNVGLGHEFLRHITRCRLLLFVVDAAAVDQRDPISDIQKLRTEIKLYDEELSARPWFIVANKIDLEESELFLDALKNRFPKQEIIPISAETGEGLDELREKLKELVGKRPE